MAESPRNPDVLYVGSDDGAMWRTLDGGANWTDITSNIPNIPVHCIVVDPDDGNSLYVGSDLGVYVSVDQGGTWASMNTGGFANVVVETLEFQNASTLYAFTHGRGAYRASVTPTLVTISGTILNGGLGEPGVTLGGLRVANLVERVSRKERPFRFWQHGFSQTQNRTLINAD